MPPPRRIFLHHPLTALGSLTLAPDQAHHLRDVLRLAPGDEVEVFDAAGHIGRGYISTSTHQTVIIDVTTIERSASASSCTLTIASAIPKSARADWMIEKLAELGVHAFIPLSTQRSIVAPKGSAKTDRWHRLATEAARQSSAPAVMRIDPLTDLASFLSARENLNAQTPPAQSDPAQSDPAQSDPATSISPTTPPASALWYLSPAPAAPPLIHRVYALPPRLTLLIGPEGGWSPDELTTFALLRLDPVRLTTTTLRIETAALTAAALIQCASSITP